MKPISTGNRSVQDLLHSMVEQKPRRVTDMDPSSDNAECGYMKYQDGGVTPTDPKKLKKGLSHVESRGDYSAMNPTSSATGRYQMLYNLIKDQPEMSGVSRDSLSRAPELQELLMDKRISEGINGPSLSRNASDLEKEYKHQLGDKWVFSDDEVAALTHFLGRQGTRKYFASLRDGTEYEVPGQNKTPEEYLRLFNEGVNRK